MLTGTNYLLIVFQNICLFDAFLNSLALRFTLIIVGIFGAVVPSISIYAQTNTLHPKPIHISDVNELQQPTNKGSATNDQNNICGSLETKTWSVSEEDTRETTNFGYKYV